MHEIQLLQHVPIYFKYKSITAYCSAALARDIHLIQGNKIGFFLHVFVTQIPPRLYNFST